MFEHFKKYYERRQQIQQGLDLHDPIDQQILKLMDANKISVDIIDLDEPIQQKKKQREKQ